MDFSSIEKQSIISLMVGIIEADGWIDDEEIEFAEEVLDAIDCSEDDFDLGQEMPLLPALVTIKNMTNTSSWRLESEQDIDTYLAALRKALIEELEGTDIVNVEF